VSLGKDDNRKVLKCQGPSEGPYEDGKHPGEAVETAMEKGAGLGVHKVRQSNPGGGENGPLLLIHTR